MQVCTKRSLIIRVQYHNIHYIYIRTYSTTQRNGKYILCTHLHRAYEASRSATGLYTTKLKTDHLKLTSYSKMRVDLAAQVSMT